MYVLSFDGLFRSAEGINTTGFMGFGWVIYRHHVPIAQGYGVAARATDATSCVAEYLGLIDGLEMLVDMDAGGKPVTIKGDAKVVIEQLQGSAKVNAERVIPLHKQAQGLAERLNITQWEWVPRKKNKAADRLTRQAMRELRQDQGRYNSAKETIVRESDRKVSRLYFLSGMQVIHRRGPSYAYAPARPQSRPAAAYAEMRPMTT